MFKQPTDILTKERMFRNREVGLTHPDYPSYIKLADNGDIHIMVDGDTGIILSKLHQSIILVGDVIKFVSKEDGGLRWNQLNFNSDATSYNEPTFIYASDDYSMYAGVDDFLDW